MSVKYNINYIDKYGNEKVKKLHGSCFGELAYRIQGLSESISEITSVSLPLLEQINNPLANFNSEYARNTLHDLYKDMNLKPFLLNNYDECLSTGEVKASPEYDGRFVVNTLSFFRQFFEHSGFFTRYSLYRDHEASPLEAFVLANSFSPTFDFHSGKYTCSSLNITEHSAVGNHQWAKRNWEIISKGMDVSKNRGELISHPNYIERVGLVHSCTKEYQDTMKASRQIVKAFEKGGIKGLIEEWRKYLKEDEQATYLNTLCTSISSTNINWIVDNVIV